MTGGQVERDPLTEKVIGLAIEVHRALGPGLLESAYERCFCYELKAHGVPFRQQVPLPVIYKTINLDCGYRMDVVIDDRLVVELKTVDRFLPVHEAQLLNLPEAQRDRHGPAIELQHGRAQGWNPEAGAVNGFFYTNPLCLGVSVVRGGGWRDVNAPAH